MPEVAVVIATRNRPEAIRDYALMSLERSEYRDFSCVIWDASDDGQTAKICEEFKASFELIYKKAPRLGASSQRNDGTRFALARWPEVKYIQYIDDDCELSRDCLGGMVKTFEDNPDVYGVGEPLSSDFDEAGVCHGKTGGVPTTVFCTCWPKFKYINIDDKAAIKAIKVEWLLTCACAFKSEIFTKFRLHFPEAFEKYSGWAAAEDLALSAYLCFKCGKRLVITATGTVWHHYVKSGRLSSKNLGAGTYWNHVLFAECMHSDVHGLKKAWLMFWGKFFAKRRAIGLKSMLGLHVSGREEMIAGYRMAKEALRAPHNDLIKNLIQDRD